MTSTPVGDAWYLSFGSFWSGIKLVQLDPSTGLISNATLTSLATRTADGGAEEASVVYQHGDNFYLFVSWDHCCNGLSHIEPKYVDLDLEHIYMQVSTATTMFGSAALIGVSSGS